MFLKLYSSLRRNGIPVSLKEYLDLLDGLNKGLCNNNSLEEFYNFSKLCLIKDEKNFDKFDQVFNNFYYEVEKNIKNLKLEIPEEWVIKELKKNFSEEFMKSVKNEKDWKEIIEEFEKRLKEQKKRHQGGNKWIGTNGTSMFGNSGYNPKGVRVGGKSKNKSAMKIWEKRKFRNLDDSVNVNIRNIQLALRKLRKLKREGQEEEFDLENTIKKTAKNAGLLDIVYRPERTDKVRVLLLIDIGGSMDEHAKMCEELFSAAKSEFKSIDYFYFHNCVYENLWKDNDRRHNNFLTTDELLNTFPNNTKIIFIGDALMSPYEIVYQGGSIEHWNEMPGSYWLKKIVNQFSSSIWLNPELTVNWEYSQSTSIIKEIMKNNMFQLNLKGIELGIKKLLNR